MDYLFLPQEVVVGSDPVVNMRLQTQLDVIVLDGQVFRRLHVSDNVVKYLDVVDAPLNPVL